jgi:hypothetical protein
MTNMSTTISRTQGRHQRIAGRHLTLSSAVRPNGVIRLRNPASEIVIDYEVNMTYASDYSRENSKNP